MDDGGHPDRDADHAAEGDDPGGDPGEDRPLASLAARLLESKRADDDGAQPDPDQPNPDQPNPDQNGTDASEPDARRVPDGSALSIVAFIFALLGFCPALLPTPMLAVLLGHIARRQQRRARVPTGGDDGAPVRGGGLALAALVIGYSLIALYGTLLTVGGTLLVLARSDATHLERCHENIDNLARAVHQYAHAHHGQLPTEIEDLRPYFQDLDALLHCPADTGDTPSSYKIVLQGHIDDQLRPQTTVLLRETRQHHLFGRRVVCYLDGKTAVIRR